MPWYELEDVSLSESGKPFIWDEYEAIIYLCPCMVIAPSLATYGVNGASIRGYLVLWAGAPRTGFNPGC
jgi:hypothetical protein